MPTMSRLARGFVPKLCLGLYVSSCLASGRSAASSSSSSSVLQAEEASHGSILLPNPQHQHLMRRQDMAASSLLATAGSVAESKPASNSGDSAAVGGDAKINAEAAAASAGAGAGIATSSGSSKTKASAAKP
eukprot:CAMPEP_0206542232 /NCGR_PEP_ID=MMETSP0325_2-20121206/10054_1 /ASSEMBLY_ACC=CAM_ASM_000347 /TAXON_ID=2866 /ORGANISM="Crypthecodinium cohnii, Strain Seligo" /LENGTH=131 /DNA_ID=CAMNT_0054040259 /DNA_START=255 /DNA_END=646 /DNA_ORIENTATION=-